MTCEDRRAMLNLAFAWQRVIQEIVASIKWFNYQLAVTEHGIFCIISQSHAWFSVHCVPPTAAPPLTLQCSISELKSPTDCSTAKWLLAVWTQKWCKAENIAAYSSAPKLATASLDLITSQTFLVTVFLNSWQWQIFQSVCWNSRVYILIHFFF